MAASATEIANSALIKIGAKTISSLTEDRKAARVANRQYPLLRQKLLRSYRWNFAVKRSPALAPDGTAPEMGFTNRFAFPSDCLRVLGIFDEDEPSVNYTSSRIPFKVEGRFVFTDEAVIQLFYIADVTDTAQFDPQFQELLAIDLAIDLAYELSSGLQRIEQLRADRRDAIREARNTDAIEGNPEVVAASDWIDSRIILGPPRIGPVWPGF